MKLGLDKMTVDIACPKCKRKITETIGKLKTNPTITCPGCREPIGIKANNLSAEVAKAEKSAAELGRKLGGMFK